MSKGFPSAVWQQQMETAYLERYNKRHWIKIETPVHPKRVKQDISKPFPPLPKIPDYAPQFLDPHNEQDPYCKDDLYNQENLKYKHNFNRPLEQIEDDDVITHSHVSHELRYALIDIKTVNPQLPNTSPLPKFGPPTNFTKCQTPVIDTEIIPQH